MARRKTSRRRQRRRRQPTIGLFRFMLGPVVFGTLFAVLVLLMWADQGIRERFSGELHVQPAQIFSRPQPLAPGLALSADELVASLRQLDYRDLGEAREPGTYARRGNTVDVALREIDADIADQPPEAVRLAFSGGRLTALTGLADQQPKERVYLEPTLVGSLQLGAYEDRITTSLHEVPEALVHSLLVMEDRDFYTHMGIDPEAVGRALWFNLREGRAAQGGSTLTQQLVKNLFLSPQRTLSRKGLEAIMAVTMELRFTKAEILELYLNEIFLGQAGNRAVHGFALASEFYFGKPLDQLRLHEAATLVGLVPAPSYYNPRRHPERALKRRNLVLKTLADTGYIDADEAAALSTKPLGVVPLKRQTSNEFPAYVDYLHRQLRQYYAENVLRNDGLKLYTSLDPGVQRTAQQALGDTLGALETERGLGTDSLQGAVVVVDVRSGELLALVGDRVRGFSGFNRAVDAHRPIGSLVKPVVYLSALEQPAAYSLATWLEDSPLTVESPGSLPWTPQNYDREYRGDTTVIEALTHSYNVPTVRLGLELGVDRVIETLHRLGIERHIEPYPSTLLGASQHSPLEMAQAYQVLANSGDRIPLRSLRAIYNNRDETIARFPATARRVVAREPAFLIDFGLKQVVKSGTAARLNQRFSPDLELAGKTGTTDDYRDSWFAGYSGNLLAVVWVGRDDNKPVGLTGSGGAMRVWEKTMAQLPLISARRDPPSAIHFVAVDTRTGLRANAKCDQQLALPFVEDYTPELFADCAGISGQLRNWFNVQEVPSLEAVPLEEKSR